MNVVVTGASSFLGAHLARRLAARRPDWRVTAVVNRTPLALRDAAPDVRRVDLTAPGAADALAAARPDAIVHLAVKVSAADAADVNLAMLDAVLDAARRAGAAVIHGSTTQVSWARLNAYARGRIEEERRVAASGLSHVMLRPCAPYGPALRDHRPAHTESFHRLAELVRRWPAVPVIGSGRQLRQPVHVDDWNDVIVRFLDRVAAGGALPDRAFDVGGPKSLALVAIVDRLAIAYGRRCRAIPVPIAAARVAARLVDGLTPDLVDTFDCDDTVDPAPLVAATGKTEWIRFEDGVRDLVGAGWRHWEERVYGTARRAS